MKKRFRRVAHICVWIGLGLASGSCSSGGGGGGGNNGGGGGGGGGGGNDSNVSAQNSTVQVDVPFGQVADGGSEVRVLVTVLNEEGDPLVDQWVEISATGIGAQVRQPIALTDANGLATGWLRATVPGSKTVSALINPGRDEVALVQEAQTEFIRIPTGARYVRTSGSDANDGLTPLTAWRTLSFAATQAGPGQTIFVGAGTYAESVEFTGSGLTADTLVFHGDVSGCYTGDAGTVLVDAQGAAFAWRLNGATGVTLRGFTAIGAVQLDGSGAGILVDGNSSEIELFENVLYGSDRGIVVRNAEPVSIESNRISNHAFPGDGIVLETTNGSNVVNNVVYNNAGCGIVLERFVANASIGLNTLYANADDQICERALSSGILTNNVVTGGLANGVQLVTGSLMQLDGNLVWNHTGFDVTYGSSGTESGPAFSDDPLYADPAGADGLLGGPNGADDNFLFQATSPTLDLSARQALVARAPIAGSLATQTSRADGELDGSGVDGDSLNLGAHVAADLDPTQPLPIGSARATYAKANNARLLSRQRDSAWSMAENRMLVEGGVLKWTVSAISPLGNGEELLASLTDDGVTGRLVARHFDGRRWDLRPLVLETIASANTNQRGFDLVCEDLSGEGLLVYADATANPMFRTFQNGNWSDPEPVFATPLGTGTVLWVELVQRTGTDEVALVTLDDDEQLVAAFWNGQNWDAGQLLDDQIAELRLSKAFDAAFEASSGDLLVAYGHTALVEETRYATRDAATGTWNVRQAHSTDAVGAVFKMASDPRSDRIVAGVCEGNLQDDTVGMIWDGDQWTHIAEMDLESAPGQLDLLLGFVGDRGEAVLVWRNANDTQALDWALWDSGGWKIQADVTLPAGVGEPVLSQSRIIPGQDRLLTLFADDAQRLFALSFDGTRWMLEFQGGPVAEQVATMAGMSVQPFHLAFR